jgi:hypothetical protein
MGLKYINEKISTNENDELSRIKNNKEMIK